MTVAVIVYTTTSYVFVTGFLDLGSIRLEAQAQAGPIAAATPHFRIYDGRMTR